MTEIATAFHRKFFFKCNVWSFKVGKLD